MLKNKIVLAGILAIFGLLVFVSVPSMVNAAADITISSAVVNSSNTVLVTLTNPGQNITSVDYTKWHIDVGGGGTTPLTPASATITSAGTPWTLTLTFTGTPFSDTATAYSASEGLYVDALAVTDANTPGDTNVVVGHASSTAITDAQAPAYVSSATLDNNNDGTVDFVKVVYSEPIQDSSVVAADFEAGIANTTAGNLTETFTSLTPSSGVLTDVANDATIYIGVATSGETISTNKTDYTLKIQQVGSVADNSAAHNALTSFTLKTSTDGAAPIVVSVSPLNSTTNQIINSSPVVLFSEPMDTASLTFSSNPSATYTPAWTVSNTTVTEAHANYVRGTTVTATISAVNAAAGSPVALIGLPYTWAFNTELVLGGGGLTTGVTPVVTPVVVTPEVVTQQIVTSPVAPVVPVTPTLTISPEVTMTPVAYINFIKAVNAKSTVTEVKNLQKVLNTTLNLNLKVDGKFGAKTTAAVKQFQRAKNITPVNGLVGPKTRAAMNALQIEQ